MSAALPVRVSVPEVWDEVLVELPASAPVAALKRTALERAGVTEPPEQFAAKFRGALLLDEECSLAQAGLVPNAAVVLVARRRRPVR